MKRRIFSGLLALVLMIGSLGVQTVEAAETVAENGTTYYVSSLNGNDNYDGLSEETPFYSLDKINEITLQPGDRVLLEADSVFTNGYLHIKGSGSPEAPIVIDRYGEGNNPRIDTNGQGVWYQDYGGPLDSTSHKYEGYVSSSILLYDVEYIEVGNLEITNKAPEIETVYNALDTMNRTGVAAVAKDIGTVDHIVLRGLNVHDVIGNVYDKHMNNGGIYFTVFKPENEAATGISRYDDVLIENCIVKDVNRWGIAVGYTIYHAKFNPAAIKDEVIAQYGSGNVVIRNNYLEEIGGDAITLMYCDRPLIEYNVSKGAAKQINGKDYSATGSGRVAAGIWPWKCKDAVFQYNECYDMYANQDGQAWDADSGDGTIYQYNYSHNNGGGCIMFCAGQAINNIFRYNISYKESAGAMNNAGNPDAHVYNNTFYIAEGQDFIRTNMAGGGMVLENNIFYYAGATEKTEDWYKHGNATKYVYDNNLYYGYANTPAGDANAIVADPKFVEAAEAPKAPTGVSALSGENITYSRETVFDMFKLSEDSPAINKGKVIVGNGGKDFYGNEVKGIPDLGAFETGSAVLKAGSSHEGVTVSEEDKTISMLDTLEMTGKDLKEAIAVDNGVAVTITRGGKALADDKLVEDGDVLTISYGGEKVDFTVVLVEDPDKRVIPVEYLKATAGDEHAQTGSEGPASNVLDDDMSTIWHTDWYGTSRANHWIQLELTEDYIVDSLRYYPRTNSTNGTITQYEIKVSNDGSEWTTAATGTLEASTAMKVISFEPQQAKYVRFVSVNSAGPGGAYVFASAAELRLLGVKVADEPIVPEIPETEVCKVFTDVAHGAWYEGAVQYVYDAEIILGNEGLFSPDDATTRAMVAMIFYRLEGSPVVTDYAKYNQFTDVAADAWYADAVAWAMNVGLATGDDYNMLYNPNAAVTREQLATFLYRYAEFAGKDVTVESEEADLFGGTYVSEWAKAGFAWAVENGIIKGAEMTDDAGNTYPALNPQGGATRAEFATVLQRYLEEK